MFLEVREGGGGADEPSCFWVPTWSDDGYEPDLVKWGNCSELAGSVWLRSKTEIGLPTSCPPNWKVEPREESTWLHPLLLTPRIWRSCSVFCFSSFLILAFVFKSDLFLVHFRMWYDSGWCLIFQYIHPEMEMLASQSQTASPVSLVCFRSSAALLLRRQLIDDPNHWKKVFKFSNILYWLSNQFNCTPCIFVHPLFNCLL